MCGRPRLMLVSEQLGLIDEVMHEHVDIRVQRQALDCWYDILESQERKTDRMPSCDLLAVVIV